MNDRSVNNSGLAILTKHLNGKNIKVNVFGFVDDFSKYAIFFVFKVDSMLKCILNFIHSYIIIF